MISYDSTSMNIPLGSLRVIEDPSCPVTRVQVRKPRSKKRRIRKKWRKREANWEDRYSSYIVADGIVVMHPVAFAKIENMGAS